MGQITDDFELECVLSESKIALKFAQDNKDKIRFCRDNTKWYCFDGNRWKEDPKCLDVRAILDVSTREYFNNLPGCSSKKHQVKLQKFYNKCLRSNSLKQILACAEIIPEVQILKENFDRNLEILVTPSGTVELSTGKLRKSRVSDYMTKIAATKYDPDLDPEKACPRFNQFMNEVTGGDEELREHLLKILSYCLTGLSTEHKVYLLFGVGANGKTVLLEVFRAVLGTEFVIHVDSKTLVKNSRVIREDVARFDGARSATCSEIANCDTLDESLIKGLSGGDRQVSRKLRENSTEFENQAKIIIATNYLPDLEGTDHGIARRLEVIPFKSSFLGNADPSLKDKLIEEREGILALLVQYTKDVIKNGVGTPPPAVKEETDRYIKFGNSVKCFIYDCCTCDTSKRITPRESFDAYKDYCNQNRVKAVSMHDFPRLLKTMGFEQRKSGNDRYWLGFSLNSNVGSTGKEFTSEVLNDADQDTDGSTEGLEDQTKSLELNGSKEGRNQELPSEDDTGAEDL